MPATCAPVLVTILVSYMMIVLDISIVITALPQARAGLGVSTTPPTGF